MGVQGGAAPSYRRIEVAPRIRNVLPFAHIFRGARDEVVAVFPRGSPLRRGGRPNVLQALRQNRLLLWGPSRDETFDAVTSWAIAKGCVRDDTVWIPHVDSLIGMVAARAGATLLPKYTVREAKEAGRVRLVSLPELKHTLRFFLATRCGQRPNPTLDAVLSTIRTGARLALADRRGASRRCA